MSWGEASSLASRTNNKQFPPSGPGTLLAPVSKPALLTCSSDYRWLCSQSAGCESRLGQAGWRQEVTDARQPQDQSTHWTRPADAARRIASATGPSAHHRGTPSSIIHPSLAHAARSSLSRPVSQSWRNVWRDWELSGRPTTPSPRCALAAHAFSPSSFVLSTTLLPRCLVRSQRQRLN